jgi:hypothetical protein
MSGSTKRSTGWPFETADALGCDATPQEPEGVYYEAENVGYGVRVRYNSGLRKFVVEAYFIETDRVVRRDEFDSGRDAYAAGCFRAILFIGADRYASGKYLVPHNAAGEVKQEEA